MAIHINHRTNTITTGNNVDAPGVTLVIGNTGSITLPKGSTANRPSTPVAGDFRFNTDTGQLEYYDGTSWQTVVAGAGGYTEDLRDSFGNYIVDGISVGGTVANYLTVTNASASQAVEVGVAGTDANISLVYRTKGTGTHRFYAGSTQLLEVGSVVGGVNLSTPADFNVTASGVAITGTGNVKVQGNTVSVVLNGAGKTFTVSDGTNNTFKVITSGSNGLTFEAGGSEAKFVTAGDLFINSTGGDIRLGNGTNQALIIDANTPGHGLTLTTLASSVHLKTEERFVFTNVSGAVIADFSNKRIAGVADPVNDTDAANKRYVDAVAAGLDWKESVRVATTVNIDLSGLQTIDGVVLHAGDRVLVKNQVSAEYNGIYIASSGTWTRAFDADSSGEVTAGLAVFVEKGNTYADTGWVLITNDPINLGTTPLVFTQFTGAAALTIDGEAGIIATLSGSVWNITADTDETTITKGTGAAGQLSVYAGAGVLPGQVLRAPAATPGIAQWGALDLANPNAVTGVLPVVKGGTGHGSYNTGDILYAVGTTDLSALPIGPSSNPNLAYVLKTKSNGTGPEWGTINLEQLGNVSAPSVAVGDILQYDGVNWVPVPNTATDRYVRVNSSDPTSGYLNEKISAKTALSKTVDVSGSSYELVLSVVVDNNTIITSANQLSVGGGAGSQILVAGVSAGVGAAWLSAAWFSTVALAGNFTGTSVVAAGFNGTVTLSAGLGIALNGNDTTDVISLSLSNNLTANATAKTSDKIVIFDPAVSDEPRTVTVGNLFNSLKVVYGVTSNGLVVNNGGTFSARSIVASTSADLVGIAVQYGDGVSGNPTIGLDIFGLTTTTTLDVNNDYVPIYRSSTDANVKVSIANLVNATIDPSRIHDAADTTYVDTDEQAKTVVVAASGSYVAKFVAGAKLSDQSDQFFLFNAGTSAKTLRIEAQGSASDIHIRLVPKGNGQVFVGDVGDGVIASDDGFNLVVTGGTGKNLYLKGGNGGGTVKIVDHTSAPFVNFNNNHSITVYAVNDTNASYEDLIFVGTTTDASAQGIGLYEIDNDATVTFDFLVVGRDQTTTNDTKSVGYRIKGVATKVAGSATTLAVIEEVLAEGANATGYAATINTATSGLRVVVKGAGTDNVKWVATGRVVKVVH